MGENLVSLYNRAVGLEDDSYASVAGYFIGPKAENQELYLELLNKGIQEHLDLRKSYYPDEESYIDDKIKATQQYKDACNNLATGHAELCERLKDSVPFFSQRYQGHMLGDTVMAGTLGYISALLYNQNNVATEASPITSELEQEVGKQLCEMLGFPVEKECKIKGWGHITADGTIANIEAMWAARNLKGYPLAVSEMLLDRKNRDIFTKEFSEEVTVQGNKKSFCKCSSWELMNLSVDEILELAERLVSFYKDNGITTKRLDSLLKPYLLATKGIAYYVNKYPDFANCRIFVPVTHHYSWPKSATLLGLGQDSVIGIPVDEYCKMDMELLRQELKNCQENKSPVLMVVAVIGSTSEGAIDNLAEILSLREDFAEKLGLQYPVHCDAAWGGYLASMLPKREKNLLKASHYVPSLPLSDYAQMQYACIPKADTVTIDPHKAGFIPYAAGALCYRNGNMRDLITFNAAYIHSDAETNMGIYGLEGSKPGAAAAAVWLAHKAIPLTPNGYGRILGECNYSSKLNYCYWITMKSQQEKEWGGAKYSYCVQPLVDLPKQINSAEECDLSDRDTIFRYIQDNIIGKSAEEIAGDATRMTVLRNVGTDVLMNTFVVNFSKDQVPNADLDLLNKLNNRLFQRFSIIKGMKPEDRPKYMLMMNTLSSNQYGAVFEHIKEAWSLNAPNAEYSLNVLVNTVMQPFPNTPQFMAETLQYLDSVIWEEIEKIVTA